MAPVQPVRAGYTQIGHTTDVMNGQSSPLSSGYRPKSEARKLPIAYSPEWLALREHTKEIESL